MRKLKLEELKRLPLKIYKKTEKIPVVIVLDNIRSGLNVGAVFRTADAFEINKLYLCGFTAVPPHREILKTAIGSDESVEWEHVKSIDQCIKHLKENEFQIVVVEQTDQSVFLHDFTIDHNLKYALVFGNEVRGVSESILGFVDKAIEIPQHGTKHSLNISVCSGIVIWTFWKSFRGY